jgi:malonate-semialdehyde dehydrogenase (acetylating)/methylmalonate-semialdehyde dehydrogenase
MTSTLDNIATLHHFIGGDASTAGDRTSPVYNPATGVQTGQVPLADAATLTAAVDAAETAAPAWRSTGMAKRANIMFNLRQIITARRGELAAIITAEHGKVLDDADGEITRGLENVEFCAGLVHHMKGETLEQASTGVDVTQLRQPVGVVACITPFNFPAMVPLWMVTTAIAAGNTVILKPSEKVPSAALWLAEAFREAGLPDGVLNVVNGDKETVDRILDEPRIKAVSFVGSTPIARHIYTTAAANGKRVQALGGAKNHMVVMPDADLDAAADAAVSAGYGAAGERCMAVSVVVAVGDIADELVAKDQLPDDGPHRRRRCDRRGGHGPGDHRRGEGPDRRLCRRRRRGGCERRRRRPGRPRHRPAGAGLLHRPDPAGPRDARECGSTTRRSSARSCRSCGWRPTTRRWS